MASNKASRDTKAATEGKEAHNASATSSPNELLQYRQTAQQNSMDAIRAAEQRYEKAKQSGASALSETKDAAKHGTGAATAYVTGKGVQAKDSAMHAMHAAKDYETDKGRQAYDYAAEKGREGYEYSAEKGQQGYQAAKDTVVSAGQTVAEKGQQGLRAAKDSAVGVGRTAADYTQQGLQAAKDSTVSVGQTAAEKGQQGLHAAKDSAVSAGQTAADYTQQMAVQTKDYLQQKGQQAKDATVDAASESKHKLGEQTRGNQEKLSNLSIGGDTAGDEDRWRVEDQPRGERKAGDVVYTENVNLEGREVVEKKGSLLGAVGETVIEIARSAKDLLIGRDSNNQKD